MGNLKGEAFLQRTNDYTNWTFVDLDPLTGDPRGFPIGMPEDPEGVWVYISEVNEGPSTMTAHNTSPADIDEDSYLIDEKPGGGHSPATQASATDLIAPPSEFFVEVVPDAKRGFKGGDYIIAYTLMKGSRHTKLSPGIKVTVGTNQVIRVQLGNISGDGATAIGIWMSRVNGPFKSMRLQKIVPIRHRRPTDTVLRGPWARRGKTPAKNETKKEAPSEPKLSRVPGAGRSEPGIYSVEITEFEEDTGAETERSLTSATVEITEGDADNHVHLKVEHPELESEETRYNVYVTQEVDGVSKEFRLIPEGETETKRGFSTKDKAPTLSGATTDTKKTSGAKLSSDTSSTSSGGGGGAGGGLEDPTTPLDGATPEGRVLLDPGKYWVGGSYYLRGEQTTMTLAANPDVDGNNQPFTITSGQTLRIWFPDSVNLLRNSQFLDLDADGKPNGWTLNFATGSASDGSFDFDEDGRLRLIASAHTNSPYLGGSLYVDRQKNYTFGGTLSLAQTSGNAIVELEQYDDANTLLTTTNIDTISASGEVDFVKTFGPNGTAFNDATVRVVLVVRFSVGSANGTITISELYAPPHRRRVRRRERRTSFREATNPTPLPHVRWKKGSDKGIEPPPAKSFSSSVISPIDFQGFESGALSGGWTLRQSDTGNTVAAITTSAAIDSLYGINFQKNTSSNRYLYVHKTYSENRDQLAAHAKFRVNSLPTSGTAAILFIKDAQADENGHGLGRVRLSSAGILTFSAVSSGGSAYKDITLATGIQAGDVLDVELLLVGAHTSKGYLTGAVGINGEVRDFTGPEGPYNWDTRYAKTVMAGVSSLTSNSARFNIDVDSITVTDTGDRITAPSVPPILRPLPLPSAPYQSVTPVETVGFEGGTVPTGWSLVGGATTGTAYAIENTWGLRATATGSSYVERALASPQEDRGFRARIRVVARPTSGTVRLVSMLGEGSKLLGYFYIDSVGDVYAQSVRQDTTMPAARKLLAGVANGTILTLELVALGSGGPAGSMNYWLEAGGTGSYLTRTLGWQDSSLDWTGARVTTLRAGGINSTAAFTLDVDALVVTEAGEVRFVEYSEDGTRLNQVNVHYAPGQPVRDDIYANGWQEAVVPGQSYRAAIEHEHVSVPDDKPSFPYSISAYDKNGKEYPLGSILQDTFPSGVTGTALWADYQHTYNIPEVYDDDGELIGCFEVRMTSPGISEGEYGCMTFSWSPGTVAIREVSYSESGILQAVFDTEVAEKFLALNAYNEWLSLGNVVDLPEGTSVTAQWQSSDTNLEPTSWISDPTVVPQKKWAHAKLTLNASPDLKRTPTVAPGSPFVDMYSYLYEKSIQAPSLLRADGSEFPGGVYCTDVQFPHSLSEFDSSRPRGRYQNHRRYPAVGEIEGFTIVAFDEEGWVEIEQNSYEHDYFMLEFRDRRAKLTFGEQIIFSIDEETLRRKPDGGKWVARAEASVSGPVDVITVIPMKGLAGVSL